jgi:hypothetical protein
MRKWLLPIILLGLGTVHGLAQNPGRAVDDTGMNMETEVASIIDSVPSLKCIAEAAMMDKNLYLVIQGYGADGKGSDAYKLELSRIRAKTVLEYLFGLGAPVDRMMIEPRGNDKNAPKTAKVVILTREKGFKGPFITKLDLRKLPCGGENPRVPVDNAVGVIKPSQEGTALMVTVDYNRIRADFRNEVQKILASERIRYELEQENRRADAEQRSIGAVRANGSFDFRVGLKAGYSKISGWDNTIAGGKQENPVWGLDGGVLWSKGEGTLQMTFDTEGDSARRKSRIAGGGSYHLNELFVGSAFLAHDSASGMAAGQDISTRNAWAGVVRLGLQKASEAGDVVRGGLTVQQAFGQSDATVEPTQAVDSFVFDFCFQHNTFDLGLNLGGVMSGSHKNATLPASTWDMGSRLITSLELGYRFASDFRGFVCFERLPVYKAEGISVGNSTKPAETRVMLGLRIGGGKSNGLGWTNVPSARTMFPF